MSKNSNLHEAKQAKMTSFIRNIKTSKKKLALTLLITLVSLTAKLPLLINRQWSGKLDRAYLDNKRIYSRIFIKKITSVV